MYTVIHEDAWHPLGGAHLNVELYKIMSLICVKKLIMNFWEELTPLSVRVNILSVFLFNIVSVLLLCLFSAPLGLQPVGLTLTVGIKTVTSSISGLIKRSAVNVISYSAENNSLSEEAAVNPD